MLADRLGYDSFWLPEVWGYDAFSLLTQIALKTKRIKLGTAIVNVYSRSPALIAMQSANPGRDQRWTLHPRHRHERQEGDRGASRSAFREAADSDPRRDSSRQRDDGRHAAERGWSEADPVPTFTLDFTPHGERFPFTLPR